MVVQQHHHRPVAAGVGVHETGGRGPLVHPQTPLLLGVEPAQLRRRVVGHGTDLRLRPARLSASSAPSRHPPVLGANSERIERGERIAA